MHRLCVREAGAHVFSLFTWGAIKRIIQLNMHQPISCNSEPFFSSLCSGCLRGWVWGRSTCRTGAGRTWAPSPTAACAGCLVSPATPVSAPTWRNLRCLAFGPIRALPPHTASSVKKLQVGDAWMLKVLSFFFKYHGVIWKKKWSPCAGNPSQSSRPSCKKPCSLHTNCANCTSQAMECMWCGSAQRCVDSTAYVISFPYGQCLEWQTGECVGKCLLPSPALDRWCSPALRWSAVSSRRLVSASGQYSSLQEKR